MRNASYGRMAFSQLLTTASPDKLLAAMALGGRKARRKAEKHLRKLEKQLRLKGDEA